MFQEKKKVKKRNVGQQRSNNNTGQFYVFFVSPTKFSYHGNEWGNERRKMSQDQKRQAT